MNYHSGSLPFSIVRFGSGVDYLEKQGKGKEEKNRLAGNIGIFYNCINPLTGGVEIR
jgi:hypothetical protein